jgi:esterase/lipase superfamily enzyme
MSELAKTSSRWYSHRVQEEVGLVRWGTYGRPVLVFPSAGGDCEEIERNGLVDACADLISAGQVKLYSVDSVAGQVMMTKTGSTQHRTYILNQYHECVRREVVPAIHHDLGGPMDIIAAGPSIGAFNSVAVLCRYPDVFCTAVGMSGSYRIERFYDEPRSEDIYFASPLQFLPDLQGQALDLLRQRYVVLASGEGAWENVGDSWLMASALGAKGIPNRVDNWGPEWEHEWPTWQAMLPHYLREFL